MDIDPDRLVYHRGRVLYAREVSSGQYRHAIDVENGLSCGCTCDECEGPLVAKANRENIQYLKQPYFAHISRSSCASTGPRDLVISFSLAIKHTGFLLPAVEIQRFPNSRFTYSRNLMRRIVEPIHIHPPEKIELVTGVQEQWELMTSLPNGERLRIICSPAKRRFRGNVPVGTDENTIRVIIRPDHEGKLFMRDLIQSAHAEDGKEWLRSLTGVQKAAEEHQEKEAGKRERFEDEQRRISAITKPVPRIWRVSCSHHDSSIIPDAPQANWGRCKICGSEAARFLL